MPTATSSTGWKRSATNNTGADRLSAVARRRRDMRKRKFGNGDLEVSAIGLGCMGLSFGYGPAVDKQAGLSLIRSAVERGVTFFDTARGYSPFTNDELVGAHLSPFPLPVLSATKFGVKLDPDGRPRCVCL